MPADWKWSWDRRLHNNELWEDFHEVIDPQGILQVKCKYCREALKHPGFFRNNAFTTTSLTRHQSRCSMTKRTKQANGNDSSASSDVSKLLEKQSLWGSQRQSISENDVKDAVLNWFIVGNIPFQQADNTEFQKLIQLIEINGRTVKINRKNLRARLTEQAAKARQDLKAELATNLSRVSLALDCWTSRINNAYMGTFLVAYKSAL